MKILLIDDDEALTTILETAFKKAGFQITISHTGADGIDKAKLGGYDIILLDQVLTDISGNDVLKAIKAYQEARDIPVLILSNFSQQELVNQALELGAVDYVFKYQVEPSDVIEKIKQITEKHEIGKEDQV